MFRGSYTPSGEFVYTLLQGTIILILAFALSLGSAGGATPAQAAPTGSEYEVIYKLGIYIPDERPICAGRDYSIRVNLVASTKEYITHADKPLQNHVTKGVPGIPIEAFARDESVGTLSPGKLITGWNVEQDAPGEATFTFHAKNAGETELYFETLVPKAITGNDDVYVGPVKKIKVVNCKLKVNMNYLMHQSSGGTTGLLNGQMDTTLEGDGEVYQGTGILDSDRTESMAPCTFSSDGFDSPTTVTAKLTGSPDNQQLEVTVDYEPGESSTTITCPIGGTRTTTRPEDPTDWLATTATFLGTGGAQSFPIDFAHWFGRLIITVEPVEGSPS